MQHRCCFPAFHVTHATRLSPNFPTPQLAKHWKHLAKREGKAAKAEGYVPVQQRPEAAFLPGEACWGGQGKRGGTAAPGRGTGTSREVHALPAAHCVS